MIRKLIHLLTNKTIIKIKEMLELFQLWFKSQMIKIWFKRKKRNKRFSKFNNTLINKNKITSLIIKKFLMTNY
jgi:hypothetical protein